MVTDAKKQANARYDKSHTQSVLLKLNKQTDADVLAVLDSKDNRQGYIKNLIRNDLRGHGDTLPRESITYLVKPVAKKYGIERIYLFGSYARGEENAESDVDLMIEGGKYKSLLELVKLHDAFKAALGKDVDVVERSQVQNDDSRSGRRFRYNFERDKVLVYENC
ncbi:MAG: nucleotidyltransferase domain-containing protein [Eubacterium sp.]|nr:nucleotidyltransferase domain-containing protein [Eubacterium sp.]